MSKLRIMGGSALFFYLICAVLAAVSFPVSADKCVDADCVVAAQVAADQVKQTATVEEAGLVDKALAVTPDWVQLWALFNLVFSGIAAATPTPKDDGFLLWFRKVVDVLANNIFFAKSADSVKKRYNLL